MKSVPLSMMWPMLVMLLSTGGMWILHVVSLSIANVIFRTSGGSGGPQTTVTTLAALTSAVTGDAKKVVIISGTVFAFELCAL